MFDRLRVNPAGYRNERESIRSHDPERVDSRSTDRPTDANHGDESRENEPDRERPSRTATRVPEGAAADDRERADHRPEKPHRRKEQTEKGGTDDAETGQVRMRVDH